MLLTELEYFYDLFDFVLLPNNKFKFFWELGRQVFDYIWWGGGK